MAKCVNHLSRWKKWKRQFTATFIIKPGQHIANCKSTRTDLVIRKLHVVMHSLGAVSVQTARIFISG